MEASEQSPADDRAAPGVDRRWTASLWRIVRAVLIGYALLLVAVYVFQRRLQYLPTAESPSLPGGQRYEGLRDVTLHADDGVELRAWFWPGTRGVTIVLFHGNAGNRGGARLDWLEPFHDDGFGLFLLDYRGYGGSGGSPTEQGLYKDGRAALEWLGENGGGELVYLGESIGCGVAVEMAVTAPPRALVLQSGYSSAVDIAQRAYPILPARLLMKDRFECLEKVTRLTCPLLMIHGADDTIIAPALGKRLFEAAPQPKEWYEVAGAGHNDVPWVSPREYTRRVGEFLRRALETEGR